MENILVPMTDFVLERSKKSIEEMTVLETFKNGAKITNEIFNYAKFLSQPLQKWMFVPCEEDGEVLEEPRKHFGDNYTPREETHTYFVEYKKAKERCLFEGFEFSRETANYVFFIRDGIYTQLIPKAYTETIEDLVKHNLTLTATALKQIEG